MYWFIYMYRLKGVDDFMEKLYDIYLKTQEEGVVQVMWAQVEGIGGYWWRWWKRASLGIHRCDYLLHSTSDTESARIQQVEFNTIAASFGSLSTWTSRLHRSVCVILWWSDLIWLIWKQIHGRSIRKICTGCYQHWSTPWKSLYWMLGKRYCKCMEALW